MSRFLSTSAARRSAIAVLACWLVSPLLTSPVVEAAEAGKKAAAPSPAEAVSMEEMMARARQYTQTGEAHRWLKRFLGDWETELRVMLPGQEPRPERGSSRGSWLIEGRWVKLEGSGTMMGMPLQSFHILGYDNFKHSYVTAGVQSMDTALTTSEGDVDPRTGSLITYGTLDEYLTGEHDKMVKYAWRFPDDDTIVLEVHDLPIGETGTEVVRVNFRRKKAE